MRQFSARELSFPDNRLRDFAVVSSPYVFQAGIYSLMNLPFNTLNTVASALQWELYRHPVAPFRSASYQCASRFRLFPSWSWAEWNGPFGFLVSFGRESEDDEVLLQTLRLPDGRRLTMDICELDGNPYHQDVDKIHVNGALVPIYVLVSHPEIDRESFNDVSNLPL